MHDLIEWTSYDAIKLLMIITDVIHQNSSNGKEESTLLIQGLSRAVRRLSIIFSLKSFTFPDQNRKVFIG